MEIGVLNDQLQKAKEQLQIVEKERDSLVDDFRIKESQLKNVNSVSFVNKALKDEVRKIVKSTTSSPTMSRAQSTVTSGGFINQPPAIESEYLKNVILKFLESNRKVLFTNLVSKNSTNWSAGDAVKFYASRACSCSKTSVLSYERRLCIFWGVFVTDL